MKQPQEKMAWQFTSAVLTLHRTRSQPATPSANGPTRPHVQEQRGSAGSWAITQNRHVATMQISTSPHPPLHPLPPAPQEQRWAKEANSQSKVLQGWKQPGGKRHLLVLNCWPASVSVPFQGTEFLKGKKEKKKRPKRKKRHFKTRCDRFV